MGTRNSKESSPGIKLAQSGAGATGVAAGALIGFLVGGPVGAVAGGATGALFQDGVKHVVGQVAERFTTQTEQERIGSCLVLAYEQIAERLNEGVPLREESFFRPRQRSQNKKIRSEAEDLLEGTFLASRNAYEERKVELLARFYANIVFQPEIDSAHANYVLALTNNLTYRQLVLMGIIGSRLKLDTVRNGDFREEGRLNPLQVGVMFEIYQLVTLDLVCSVDAAYMLGVADINPANLSLQGTGVQIYNLIRPDMVDAADQQFFFDAFPLKG